MASKSDLLKTIRAFTLTPVDKLQKPYIDFNNPLFWQQKGPRVDTRIPAEMTTDAGKRLTATIVLLSATGLQLTGSRQLVDCLQCSVLRFARHKPAILQLCFSLPSNLDPFDAVKVQCETVYARRTRHNTSRIGMRFLTFSEGEETLAEYLLYREATS